MIGRKREIKELNRLYESGRAELVAIYGRCRVGKTYLVDETFEGRIPSSMQASLRQMKRPPAF